MSNPLRESTCDTCGALFTVAFMRGHNNRVSCDQCMARDDYRKMAGKNSTLKNRYGITFVEFTELISLQRSQCKICGEALLSGSFTVEKIIKKDEICVDHCHSTGKVRGLLCHSCNVALGHVKDNVEVLSKMIEYVQQHKENHV